MDVCCTAGNPVAVDYTPKGSFELLGDTQLYITGAGNKAIIAIYDVFGFKYPQFQQFCDRVAAAGFLVAAPDIFRGQPWTLDKFPPKPEDNFQGWIQSYTFEAVDKDINATVNALKAKEVTKFAMLGFCWGAAQAVQAAIAHPQTYSAVGFLHPSLFGKERELCSKMQIPLFLASASGDPYESIQEAMSGTKGASKSVYRQYNNMVHGFCSARGNFDDPEDAKAVGEVIGLLTDFLRANL